MKLSTPKELGGAGGYGSNPERLFAAGNSACFAGAMKVVAGRQQITLPDNHKVTGRAGIGLSGDAFGIAVTLNISPPRLRQEKADDRVTSAYQVCPYSNPKRGNIDVTFKVSV